MQLNNYNQPANPDSIYPIIYHRDVVDASRKFLTHWHEALEFLYFVEGQAKVDCNALQMIASPGDLIIIKSGVLHSIETNSTSRCVYDTLIIDSSFLHDFGFPLNDTCLLTRVQDSAIQEFFTIIRNEFNNKHYLHKTFVKAEVIRFVVYLFHNAVDLNNTAEQKNSKNVAMVRAIITFIKDHIDQKVTLEQISDHTGYSKYYLCRIFHEITNQTVTEAMNAMKCHRAQELLWTGNCTVREAAELCGFQNGSHFSKTYKQNTGELPSESLKKTKS